MSGIFSSVMLDGPLEAAFLLKQTGIPVAAWSRSPVPQEVISVMAATMWGSLETLIRALGGAGPRSAVVEVEDRRILATLVEPHWTLLLVAPRSVGTRRLHAEARRVLERVNQAREHAGPRRTAVDFSP